MKIIKKESEAREYEDISWLNSYRTFSFGSKCDPNYRQWGSLRVINEDRVRPGKGFGLHPHREFEIFSYVVSGELTHTDSMRNEEVLKKGEVQFTSAGTGIYHSEYN
eukprot:TRINITY_DN25173_c0_g1_i1.p1 TRINITY_DN25173_c0_g1~~TRINITY_DN25173_c0_g1_i1.p1  ORF type:complete len:107 (-),score=22.59 TRINITY_DN25173_c0_g1_i1:11-331(-)